MSYIPLSSNTDGVDHINIYSKGKTPLGKVLSNFFHLHFNLPDHGSFQSIEGYWYWLLVDSKYVDRDVLRELFGFSAKKIGRELVSTAPTVDEDYFESCIKKAMRVKAENSLIRKMLLKSELPFTHYYVYDNELVHAGHDWIVNYWEEIRSAIKNCHT